MTAPDFVVRESCNMMREFPLSLASTLQSLVIIDLLEEEISSFQFVNVTSRGHMVRGSCDIMGEFSWS